MKRQLTTGALGLMLAGAATLATAQPPADHSGDRGPRGDRPPLKQVIEKADADGDGRVTYADVAAALPGFPEQAFNRLDSNEDGVITTQEVAEGRTDSRPGGDGMDRPRGPRGPEGHGRFGDADDHNRPQEFRGPGGPRGDGDPRERMEKMHAADVNGDHQVSAEEFAAAFPEAPAERFQQMDRNKDGFLSPADRPDGFGGPGGPRGEDDPRGDRDPREHMAKMRAADVNDDHQITAEEFTAAFPELPAGRFQQMDRNNDGVLSRDDRPEGGRPPHGGPRGEDTTDGDARGPRGPRPGPGFAEHIIQDADANADGQVSFEELSAAKPGFPQEVFNRMDTNGDGALSSDDKPARPDHGPGGPGAGPRGHRGPPPAHE